MLFATRKKSVYGAIFDVRSDSVGAILVASPEDSDVPEIVFSARKTVVPGGTEDVRVESTAAALKSVLADVAQTGFRALAAHDAKAVLSEALVVYGAPWSATVPRTLVCEEEQSFTVTRKLLEDLEAAADEHDEHELKAQTIGDILGYEITDRALVDVKINGYDVEDPIGATGVSLQLTEVNSLAHTGMRKTLSSVIEDVLPKARITSVTHAFAHFHTLRTLGKNTRSFCFVAVLPEVIELGLVIKDALTRVVQVPYGTKSLLRSICENGAVPEEHVRSHICLQQAGELDDAAQATISMHFKGYEDAVAKGFAELTSQHAAARGTYVLTDVTFRDLLTKKTLEAAKRATGQTHQVLGDVTLLREGSTDRSLATLARYFHIMRADGRLT